MDAGEIFIGVLLSIIIFLIGLAGYGIGRRNWDMEQERFVNCLNHENDPVWCFEILR